MYLANIVVQTLDVPKLTFPALVLFVIVFPALCTACYHFLSYKSVCGQFYHQEGLDDDDYDVTASITYCALASCTAAEAEIPRPTLHSLHSFASHARPPLLLVATKQHGASSQYAKA